MSDTPASPKKLIASFGRRKGHNLRDTHKGRLQSLLPVLLIPEADQIDANRLFPLPSIAPLWLEIGFGGGEHLAGQAIRNHNIRFIGCEPYINGTAKLLAAIEKNKLTNIRLYDGDARVLMEKMPDEIIDRLFVLFPDPWPKARHHKRRIVSQHTLELFYSKLKPGGLLRIATDHVDYGTWILEHLLTFQRFNWSAKSPADWKMPPPDWIVTRYQQKAAEEGRSPLFLDFYK